MVDGTQSGATKSWLVMSMAVAPWPASLLMHLVAFNLSRRCIAVLAAKSVSAGNIISIRVAQAGNLRKWSGSDSALELDGV